MPQAAGGHRERGAGAAASLIARPVRRLGPPSEPGHQALWMPARDAAQILDNEGDRHFLAYAFGLSSV